MSRLAVVLGVLVPVLACAPSYNAMYPHSLARVLRDETPETVAEHHRILVHVIDGFGADLPAALDLELAYYARLLGDADEVAHALESEQALHPELEELIDRAARHIRTLPTLGDSGRQ